MYIYNIIFIIVYVYLYVIYTCIIINMLGAVQLLRSGGGGRPSVTLCDEGGGSAERYVTPKIIYLYNIYYNFYYCICLFIRNLYMCYYKLLHTRRP